MCICIHTYIPIPKKGNAKECSNYCTIALISHASKVMLKILQARLQPYVNRELPDVQASFKKTENTSVGKDGEQLEVLCIVVRIYTLL